MEQAGAASVVPTGKKYESRKREASGKDMQAIRSFLESLSVYEADALRVSIAIADGKATATNISSDDRLALRVSTVGACGEILRQAAVGHGKQVVAFHRSGCGGHRPCNFLT